MTQSKNIVIRLSPPRAQRPQSFKTVFILAWFFLMPLRAPRTMQ